MTLEPLVGITEQVPQGRESQLLDDLTEWIQRHHQQGGDFSLAAISAAGEAARSALRSGYSLSEAFEAGRTGYFRALGPAPDHQAGNATGHGEIQESPQVPTG